MAQSVVGKAIYKVKTAGDKYVDLSVGMGIVNFKQYHQFSQTGRPYCYYGTIECLTGSALSVATAPCSYPVINALVQTAAGWNSQIRRTGQSKKDMSRYGQRLRCALMDDAVDNDGQLVLMIQPHSSQTYNDFGLVPAFTAISNEAGDSFGYPAIGEVTTMVIPGDSQDDEPTEEPLVILSQSTGASSTRFRAVREWTENRMATAVEPDEGREINTTNKMLRLFSDAQPESDEIVTELDEYQEVRPYDLRAQYKYHDLGKIAKNTGAGERSILEFEAMCGLIQIGSLGTDTGSKTAQNDEYLITIHAIEEM